MRKVLYSPGFGAGWTTWSTELSRANQLLMLEWPPLIAAVEAGEHPTESHPAVVSLLAEIRKTEPDADPYLGGLDQLQVAVGSGQVRIEDYDGNESVHWRDDADEWL